MCSAYDCRWPKAVRIRFHMNMHQIRTDVRRRHRASRAGDLLVGRQRFFVVDVDVGLPPGGRLRHHDTHVFDQPISARPLGVGHGTPYVSPIKECEVLLTQRTVTHTS